MGEVAEQPLRHLNGESIARSTRASRSGHANAGADPLGGIPNQTFHVRVLARQLSIDGEHGDTVDDCPYEPRELRRFISTHESGLLLCDQRIDEHLERGCRLLLQFRIRGACIDEPAEHDAVVRGVGDREPHVGETHGVEALRPASTAFPGIEELQAQRPKALSRHLGLERRLVGEMAVERRSRHAQGLADGPQGQPFHAVPLDRSNGFLDQGSPQVAVVVTARPLATGPRGSGTNHHHPAYLPHVDTVNTNGHTDVDTDNISRWEDDMERPLSRWTRFVPTLWRVDAPLTAAGLLMVVVLVASMVGVMTDPRTITGMPAWLKPAKFAASIGIYILTLAWVFTYLPGWTKTRRLVSWTTVATLVIEEAIIVAQAWRGTTSHFNVGTPLDLTLWVTMAVAIVVQTVTSVAVALALWRQPFVDRALGWALRLGMSITIVGASTGGLMTPPTAAQIAEAQATRRMAVSGAHTVGAPDGGPGVPGTGWSVEHGDLRIPHFIGIHALQVLPLIALVLRRRRWPDATRVRLILIAAASYTALFAILLWQALGGQALVRPTATTVAAFAAWASLTGLMAWMTAASRDSHTRGVLR